MHNLVNKDLGKPQYTETDAIAFYHKLGELGRSPVWTPEDIHSHYFSQIAKYSAIGIGLATVAGVGIYWFTKE
jgi:hypothetical protein